MKFTQQQLLQAARAAGLGRESFTCAELREQLRVSTKDRKKLNQFYRSFRAFQTGAESEIEKLGPNCYRLRVQAEERTVEVDPAELCEVSANGELLAQPSSASEGLECIAEAKLESVAHVAEATLESVQIVDESASGIEPVEMPAPAAAPNWRGHVQRLGSRMRSWFGGGAGAAAQA
jgi:hypothetical protein